MCVCVCVYIYIYMIVIYNIFIYSVIRVSVKGTFNREEIIVMNL